jgi:murein L,D-transpeptidase YcbB/YkuD
MDGSEVDTSSIIWSSVDTASFPYMIRQEPGPANALGKIAFMFPNKYFVYIHDTPAPYLFYHNDRAFSHGCIRIENAVELAKYILKDNHAGSSFDIQKAIDEGKTKIIVCPNPIPVYVLYLTAWADEHGTAYFTRDVYDRDRQLIDALKQIPPEPGKQ